MNISSRTVSLVLAFMTVFMSSCTKESHLNEITDFHHNSPRPACQYTIDPNREPYFIEPVVVAEGWSKPVKLSEPLNSDCPEDAIEISQDGKTLYFFWSMTVNGTNEQLLHITTGTYRAERVGTNPAVFSTPLFFDLQKGAIGGSVDGELSFTPNGDFVFFHSTRMDNTGYQQSPPIDDPLDIYVAPITNGEPGPAVNLGPLVNSVYLDGEHSLSPDGSQLILASTRPGGLGDVDLWVSNQTGSTWSMPTNLGAPINSVHAELQPGFAADDPNTLFFVSDRDGPHSIYRSTYDGKSWSEPEMLVTGYTGEPSLVSDGSIMYFVHVLVDSTGVFGSNIWYVQRMGNE